MGSGDDAACTRMFCEVYSKPYCTDEKSTTQIANPASSFCIEQGGTLNLSGSTGYCTLPNGDVHEEWEYFRANNSTPEDYVGLSIQEATDLANNRKVPFRVVQIDGQPQAVTMDLRPGRINASVQSGIVTSFTIEQ